MPITRGGAQTSPPSGSPSPPNVLGADARAQDPTSPDILVSLEHALSSLDDNSVVHRRDVKNLRDMTSAAIVGVRDDARAQTSALAQKISENNVKLSEKLNESFSAVGKRLEALPQVAMLGMEGFASRLTPFSGSADESLRFSNWLRRLEDVMHMRYGEPSEEQKAYFLIGHLEGIARERVDELPIEKRCSYTELCTCLRVYFEGPQQRQAAREKLTACRQEPAEPAAVFANRILNLVRTAMAGKDSDMQREMALEEFIARLRGIVRYYVKFANPLTFDEAVKKAERVEQLLAEAAADKLMHPSEPSAAVNALEHLGSPQNSDPEQLTLRSNPSSNRRPSQQNQVQFNVPRRQQRARRAPLPNDRTICYNCGGRGHFRSQCPSAPPRSAQGRFNRSQTPPPSQSARRLGDTRQNARLLPCVPASPAVGKTPVEDIDQRVADLFPLIRPKHSWSSQMLESQHF